MEDFRNKASYSGTAVNSDTLVRYDTGHYGAQKTWHVRTHAIAKGGRNKGGGYTSAYAPGTDHKNKSEG